MNKPYIPETWVADQRRKTMFEKYHPYRPDIFIAVLCTLIMCCVVALCFAPRESDEVVEPVVFAEEIDGPALDVEPPRTYFDVPLDKDLQDHIFDTCESYSVDPAIVVAMIERESTFRAGVIGDNNRSFGLMQIQPKWHMERMKKLGMYELLDPYQNVVVGVDFIHELLGYGRGTTWALMAYNGGPSYANKMRENGQVSDYAKDIIVRAHELERK